MARQEHSTEEIELNMTPMIDVVFNLIIFFMVITDMSQSELELLVLPTANLAVQDKGEKHRLVINVVDPNKSENKGRVDPNAPPIFFKGHQYKTLRALRRVLRLYADPTLYGERENPLTHQKLSSLGNLGGKPVYPSSWSLLVRCDQGQQFGWVQVIMQLCTIMPGHKPSQELRESPFIYKLQIAVAEKEKK